MACPNGRRVQRGGRRAACAGELARLLVIRGPVPGARKETLETFDLVHALQNTRRIARDDSAFGHRMRDDRTGADDGVRPDDDARQDR